MENPRLLQHCLKGFKLHKLSTWRQYMEKSSPWKRRWIKESWYPCNQCEYKTTHKAYLKNHIETTCEESWYPSNQCEYKTTDKANLKNYIETIHEESWYPCNQCDYKTTHKAKLKYQLDTIMLRQLAKNHGTPVPVTNVNTKPHPKWTWRIT